MHTQSFNTEPTIGTLFNRAIVYIRSLFVRSSTVGLCGAESGSFCPFTLLQSAFGEVYLIPVVSPNVDNASCQTPPNSVLDYGINQRLRLYYSVGRVVCKTLHTWVVCLYGCGLVVKGHFTVLIDGKAVLWRKDASSVCSSMAKWHCGLVWTFVWCPCENEAVISTLFTCLQRIVYFDPSEILTVSGLIRPYWNSYSE